ncbi:hypothetical protein BU16DRAFT_466739 [Lophium mytilinum]|uniref:ATP-dependent DNA ligase family profile domain-containing protein n=1 Tax=Lophium mytilinum TaxID=390894 RepID=A0A6A6QIV4_9PEZI|nr:hypothetical protein BU16DRAFT_466739 [Lophium mytilinum]
MAFKFSEVCQVLENLEKVTQREPPLPRVRADQRRRAIIVEWFAKHRGTLMEPITNGPAILSILFPERRKDMVYGMQEAKLAKKISTLMRFRPPQITQLYKYSERGNDDMPACAQRATKEWDGSLMGDPITVDKILDVLEQLAAKCHFSSPVIRSRRNFSVDTDKILQGVLIKMRSWEIKWFLRVILQQFSTVALDEKLVLTQYHFLLPELLHFQDDFEAVFDLLKGPLSCYDSKPDIGLQKLLRIEASKHLRPTVGVKVGRPRFRKAWSWKNCFEMLGQRVWLADVKYDGEYCEIHVNLEKGNNCIQIFSKSGKDSTQDRRALQSVIKAALRIGTPDCLVKSKCILLGELVVYSDREQKILEFHKIRKHVSRSGSFMGALGDSQCHDYEHLMIVFFDVLLLDEDITISQGLQLRRDVLRRLVRYIPGRAMRSEWTLLDFRSTGAEELKDLFARALALKHEGYILKPACSPYFPLQALHGEWLPNYFVKLKKDYLADMGGSKDVGDFAVVGARYDSMLALKTGMGRSIRWTDFYLGCLTNRDSVRFGGKPRFKIVAVIKSESCIPKADLAHLNQHGHFHSVEYLEGHELQPFDIVKNYGYDRPMEVAFKEPFVVEVLGSGYDKPSNEPFFMLRHPRITKIHRDRTWKDAVCMEELARMAKEALGMPVADVVSDGIAADVFARISRYQERFSISQQTNRTTQRTTTRSSQETPPASATQSSCSQSMTGFSVDACSTQGLGIRASKTSKALPVLVRADTDVFLESFLTQQCASVLPTPPMSSAHETRQKIGGKRIREDTTDTSSKRRRIRSPLADAQANGPVSRSMIGR